MTLNQRERLLPVAIHRTRRLADERKREAARECMHLTQDLVERYGEMDCRETLDALDELDPLCAMFPEADREKIIDGKED